MTLTGDISIVFVPAFKKQLLVKSNRPFKIRTNKGTGRKTSLDSIKRKNAKNPTTLKCEQTKEQEERLHSIKRRRIIIDNPLCVPIYPVLHVYVTK